ncbi:MAG: hypothetical protein R6U57_08030 [Anaerolineales bacterium]
MKEIQVTARFTAEGKIIPTHFEIGEISVKVRDLGRQWHDEKGRHMLVMDEKDQAYHLLFMPENFTWYLVRDISSPPIPI